MVLYRMADIEEVIEGLEQFRSDLKPFCGNHTDWERFDAGLDLLKEQLPVSKYLCARCGVSVTEGWRHCAFCGRELDWDILKNG